MQTLLREVEYEEEAEKRKQSLQAIPTDVEEVWRME